MKNRKAKGSDSGAFGALSVTPSDTVPVANPNGNSVRWLMPGSDGSVAVTFEDGSDAVLQNLRAGIMYPVHITHVKATGTTATNVLVMF